MYLTCDSSNPRSIGCPYAPTSTSFTEEGIENARIKEGKDRSTSDAENNSIMSAPAAPTPLQQEGRHQLQLQQLKRQRQ